MQNFFVAASDTFKPFFFSFQNPFMALLKNSGSASADAARERFETVSSLQRMAREVEYSQPGLAAELRYFASKS
ncbi:MAG: hypothetical protein RL404_679 [Pseudomonadota bacterium]